MGDTSLFVASFWRGHCQLLLCSGIIHFLAVVWICQSHSWVSGQDVSISDLGHLSGEPVSLFLVFTTPCAPHSTANLPAHTFFCFFSLPPSCLSGAHFPETNLVKIQQAGAAAFVGVGQGKAKLCHPCGTGLAEQPALLTLQWPPEWLYPAGTPISSTSVQWDSLQAAEFLSCTLWKASPACPCWIGYEWAQERWIILDSITYPLGPCSLPL